MTTRTAAAKTGRKSLRRRSISPPLPMQLLRARDAVMVRFRPHLKALGLTDQQGRILRVLAEAERLEMGELAERTCIHPASLSRIIPRLHKRGIVRRWKDRDDARRVAVSITTRGRASFAIILAESERIYADLAAEIGAGRMRALYRCLDILIETRQPAATKKPARRSTDAASWAAADPG